MKLKKEIDLAILDMQNRNYGKAEDRLFAFLDVLDAVEKRLATYEEQTFLMTSTPIDDPYEDFYD